MDPQRLMGVVPTGKSDTDNAIALVALGFPAVEPVLPQILAWVQDPNWPVARVFLPFLATIGEPLAPHVRSVLATDDDCWKYSLLEAVVHQSPELAAALTVDLSRLARHPSSADNAGGVAQAAEDILRAL